MFTLNKLILTGNDKKTAQIRFIDGTNYISGPSNKGKSFIYECLRYTLGGSKLPKQIPEAEGYTDAYLEISPVNQLPITIHRSLKESSRARIFHSKFESLNIESSVELKINSEDGSLSQFYLGLISYPASAKIRSNSSNETKRLTYNSMRSFFMISERDIVSEESYHFDFNTKSYILGIFKYILTGIDDFSLQKLDDDRIFNAKKLAKTALLRQLLKNYSNRTQEIEGKMLRVDYAQIEEYKQILLGKLEEINSTLVDYLSKYESTNNSLVSVAEKLTSERLAKKRLTTLKFNYVNDIARLSAMIEGVNFIGQLIDEKCPICGSEIHHQEGQPNRTEDYIYGAKSESDKIKRNLSEVEKMIQLSDVNINTLSHEYEILTTKLNSIVDERKKLSIEKYSSEKQLNKIVENSNLLNELSFLNKQVDEYTKLILEFDSQKNESPKYNYDIPEEPIKFIERRISRIIYLWRGSFLKVDFNFNDIDFSTNGVKRISNGKGVRGILNFAMAISIIEMASNLGRPFSRFLIVDSPFTNFRQDRLGSGDQKDDILRTEARILKDLSRNHKATQFIIMENKENFGEVNIEGINIINLNDSGFIPI